MAVLLGLLSAAAFGAGDFLGGFATKRTALLQVVLGQQLTGLVAATALASVVDADDLTAAKLL